MRGRSAGVPGVHRRGILLPSAVLAVVLRKQAGSVPEHVQRPDAVSLHREVRRPLCRVQRCLLRPQVPRRLRSGQPGRQEAELHPMLQDVRSRPSHRSERSLVGVDVLQEAEHMQERHLQVSERRDRLQRHYVLSEDEAVRPLYRAHKLRRPRASRWGEVLPPWQLMLRDEVLPRRKCPLLRGQVLPPRGRVWRLSGRGHVLSTKPIPGRDQEVLSSRHCRQFGGQVVLPARRPRMLPAKVQVRSDLRPGNVRVRMTHRAGSHRA